MALTENAAVIGQMGREAESNLQDLQEGDRLIIDLDPLLDTARNLRYDFTPLLLTEDVEVERVADAFALLVEAHAGVVASRGA